MNKYMQSIKAYLAEREPNYGYYEAHSLLELLWCSYTQSNPVENEKLKMLFDELEPLFASLSAEDSDLLFSKISDICMEYEHAAFLEGLHVGIRLVVELQEYEE